MSKPRILFVDDEPNILDGLRRMLRRKQREWELEFADSGSKALKLMEQAPYDVVVSDMRMPEMDGAELLSLVMEQYPETIRFILSGHSDKAAIMRSLPATHQYMSKPCDASVLTEQLNRALCLKQQLDNKLVRRMISEIDTLPSLPEVYQQIQRISQSDEAGVKEAADVLSADIGMSAKLLQLVNSSFFGLAREVSSVHQAVSLLGMETLKSLVLTAGVFGEFTTNASFPGFSLERFSEHCTACGALAKQIVLDESQDETMAEHAMTAGLLHDVGKLIMAAKLPDIFADTLETACQDESPIYKTELECEGFSHAAVGAYLLGLWRLPLPVLDAVAFHHCPEESGCESFTPTAAVHVANILVQERNPGYSGNCVVPEMNMAFLSKLGLEDRIERWRQIDLATVVAT